jgi:hypothetical protein
MREMCRFKPCPPYEEVVMQDKQARDIAIAGR